MRLPGFSLLAPPKPAAVAPPMPVLEPAVMPDPDDKAIKAKARREDAIVRQRSGRRSTIATAPQGTVLG